MPKKFQGTNSKAEAARARKAETKANEKSKKEKESEDKYWESWESGDKDAARKKERKDEKERKRLEQLDKKRAAKQLLEEEESKVTGKPSTTSSKVTRTEIAARQEKEAEKCKIAAAKLTKKNITVNEDPVEENINQLVAETLAKEDGVEARNVEDAISVLSVKENQESHPEKRMKAAFAKFEEERLPVLKAENANMRLSQIKQLLRKEWMKSPENPLNQNFVAYNKE